MSESTLTVVGTVAFDAIETPFGKTDKIIGGAATYISLAASYFGKKNKSHLGCWRRFSEATDFRDERKGN